MADYGFDLDGTLTGNLTLEKTLPRLNIYDDPRVIPFGELLIIKKGGDLIIKGTSLNIAATTRDIKVRVGDQPCNVTALAINTLTCQLSNDLGFDDLEVIVFIGDQTEKVGYVSQNIRNNNSNWLIVAFVIAFIGVFLTITLFILYK